MRHILHREFRHLWIVFVAAFVGCSTNRIDEAEAQSSGDVQSDVHDSSVADVAVPPTKQHPVPPPRSTPREPARARVEYHLLAVDRSSKRAWLRRQSAPRKRSSLEVHEFEVLTGRLVKSFTLSSLLGFIVGGDLERVRSEPRPGTDFATGVANPKVQNDLSRYAQILSKEGRNNREERVAVSPDGQTVLLVWRDHLYRSNDGGRTFGSASPNVSYRPVISPTGETAALTACDRRCSKGYSLWLLDLRSPKSSPRKVRGSRHIGHEIAFSHDGEWVYSVRSPHKSGTASTGCLFRTKAKNPSRIEELVCAPRASWTTTPTLAVSPDRSVGFIVGTDNSSQPARVSYAWVSFSDPSVRGQGDLVVRAPNRPRVSNGKRVAWISRLEKGRLMVLDLMTGMLRQEEGNGADDLDWWDDQTLLTVGSEGRRPRLGTRPVPLHEP